MRNLQTLDQADVDSGTGVITLSAAGESSLNPTVAMRREGDYTAIVTNIAKGCIGVPVDTVVLRQGNDPEVVINVKWIYYR